MHKKFYFLFSTIFFLVTTSCFSITNENATYTTDTLGEIHCSEVIRSEKNYLNSTAIEVVKSLKFNDAENDGNKFVAYIKMPVFYRREQKKKKK
jgi:hypothetical protein